MLATSIATPDLRSPARQWGRRLRFTTGAALAGMALLGFVTAAAITISRGWPALPITHDERSFLLAADTYAQGRLTNPTPRFWEHFETFHVLMRPTYASKYPPGQGLFLALGQRLTGAPIVGVWISTALFCAALTWMLLGWFRLKWAVFGGLLVTSILAGASSGNGYWMSSFWGGMVPATGAALVYGSVPRITRSPSARYGVLCALGMATLALSRPFEGLLVSLPALVVLGRWLLADPRTTMRWRMRRVFAPFALAVSATAAFSMLYNARVTGHPLRIPYVEYEAQYSDVPIFVLSRTDTAGTLVYHNATMRRFYSRQKARTRVTSVQQFLKDELDRAREITRFIAPGFTIVLLFVVLTSGMWRSLALPFAGVGLVLLGSLGVRWFFPHYIAPMIAPWAVVLTSGARSLSHFRLRQRRTGERLVWLIFAVTAFSAFAAPFRLIADQPGRRGRWFVRQDSIAQSLAAQGRRHLVLVSYGATHNLDQEWVYNRADLEESPVIWARSLTPEKDIQLIDYFRDRLAWRLQVDSAGVPFRLNRASVARGAP
jgi:hypothetical protein